MNADLDFIQQNWNLISPETQAMLRLVGIEQNESQEITTTIPGGRTEVDAQT